MSKVDRYSETWLAVERLATGELEKLRGKLESPHLDAGQTAYVRGQIYALRSVLKLADAKKNAGPVISNGEI